MDEEYEQRYHQHEDSNWWFVARRDMILSLLKSLKISKDASILDLGCSGGSLIKFLETNGYHNVIGVDISDKAVRVCKSKGLKNVKAMDASNLKFKDNTFDLIIASDILEHIQYDVSALKRWNSILKKGGKAIVFVPAHKFLWSAHDEINMHYRRYSRKDLTLKFKNADFIVKRSSYWNISLFFPLYLVNNLKKLFNKKKDNLYRTNHLINRLLIFLLKCENKSIKTINSPIGVSVFIVAEKR